MNESTPEIRERLEYLRGEIRAERISYGELAELQSLAGHIEPGDTELLEPAGAPEFPPENKWYAIDTEPVRNGNPGGDDEVTDAWNVRLHNDALPHAVVDVDYFAEWPGRGSGTDNYTDPAEYVVTGMIQFTVCTDREDPGGTETWADISYDTEADPLAYDDLDKADQAARYQARRWIRMAAMFMTWDGEPFRR